MTRVSYRTLEEMTQEDYEITSADLADEKAELPRRVLAAVEALDAHQGGMQVTRLSHSLQSATRAYCDGRDEAYVVAALIHDIGDELAPYSHGPMVAAIMRPFFDERLCWIVEKHPLFQTYYFAHFAGGDPNARDKYVDHPYYRDCVEFCAQYDQNCFDPNYDTLPLEFFAPMVERIVGRSPEALPWDD
jgi:predicted HD phosphohydrolase